MKKILALTALILAVAMLLPSCSTVNTGSAVMEYEGTEMGEKLYGYWVASYKRNILNYYEDVVNTEAYWNTEYADGMTIGEYFTDIIDTQVKNILIAQKLFKDYGLKLSDSVIKAIDDDINEKIEYAGSRAALNEELAKMGININQLARHCNASGEAATPEQLLLILDEAKSMQKEILSKFIEEEGD